MEPKQTTFSEENRRENTISVGGAVERQSLYCEAFLADPRITTLHHPGMYHPIEVAQVYVPLRLYQERQLKYDMPLSDEASSKTSEEEPDFWVYLEVFSFCFDETVFG